MEGERPLGSIMQLMPALLRGVVVTLELTVLAAVLAFAMSFVAGFGRLAKFWPIRIIASIYIEVFRGSSLLVQLFWMYYVLPFFGINLPAMLVGIVGVGLNYGAYGAEVVRGAVMAVPKGQTEAAIALNLTPFQRAWHIIIPQAFRTMLPSFGNLLVELLKSTSIVSLITITDLTFEGTILNDSTFKTMTIFTLLLVIYFIIGYPLTLGVKWVERKVSYGR